MVEGWLPPTVPAESPHSSSPYRGVEIGEVPATPETTQPVSHRSRGMAYRRLPVISLAGRWKVTYIQAQLSSTSSLLRKPIKYQM